METCKLFYLWKGRIPRNDSLNVYHQFVGHNPQDQPTASVTLGKSIANLDMLHKQPYFHKIHC